MEKLVAKLQKQYPSLEFAVGSLASWSPQKKQVTYEESDDPRSSWSLLHELGHALAGHEDYQSDVSLLQKETEAWERAILLAKEYGILIDDDHVQACLDTYRDWLHKRSTCPDCSSHGLQQSKTLYHCVNCQSTWMVTSARFCRPYRLRKALAA
ncbi:MAG TPA: ImmA/IrrE family metallo-endopeptidase [Candidatus Saccharimonadales bacterium]|nr:ImmA/IrrE family metallo-endopeptidase [Candidatus Saccharimonadales bacterium]